MEQLGRPGFQTGLVLASGTLVCAARFSRRLKESNERERCCLAEVQLIGVL